MKSPSDLATIQQLRSDVALQVSRFVDRERLSRVAAAKLLQIPQSTLSKIVNGRVSRLSLDLLMRIAVRAGLHLVVQTGAVPEEAGAFLSMGVPSARRDGRSRLLDRAKEERLDIVRAMTPEQRLYAQVKLSELVASLHRDGIQS